MHFGGVDQIAEAWINGSFIGRHVDGYTAFTFDVTDKIKRDGENVLEVRVTDILSKEFPYGKQRKKRGGMWYTPMAVSGRMFGWKMYLQIMWRVLSLSLIWRVCISP